MSGMNPNGNPSDPKWAWSPYRSDPHRPWNLAMAGHLYRRAAFGANWNELQRAVDEGPEKTIDRFLKPQGDLAAFKRRSSTPTKRPFPDPIRPMALRPWWLMRLMQSPRTRCWRR